MCVASTGRFILSQGLNLLLHLVLLWPKLPTKFHKNLLSTFQDTNKQADIRDPKPNLLCVDTDHIV